MFRKFTASQKRGALILLAILVGIAGWRWRLVQLEKNRLLPVGEVSPEWKGKKGKGGSGDSSVRSTQPYEDYGSQVHNQVYVELNNADTAALKTVKGIGPVFARRIVKYRNLIGGFHRKEELLKVYGIDEERYAGIAPQVWVDEASGSYPANKKRSDEISHDSHNGNPLTLDGDLDTTKLPELNPKADLNTADSLTLVGIKGIGAKTASNILKYRKLIFFFHSIDQLSEVWGVNEENLKMIRTQVFVGNDFSHLPHIEVNEMDVQELASHYYLNYKIARLIVAYRQQHGSYSSIADLEKIRGIEPGHWAQLLPYLDF